MALLDYLRDVNESNYQRFIMLHSFYKEYLKPYDIDDSEKYRELFSLIDCPFLILFYIEYYNMDLNFIEVNKWLI